MTPPVAVITGGASGIGLELAKRIARTHRAAVSDLDGERAESRCRHDGYGHRAALQHHRP